MARSYIGEAQRRLLKLISARFLLFSSSFPHLFKQKKEVLGSDAAQRVRSLVTLGTPHQPPPADSPVAALDQTRGAVES